MNVFFLIYLVWNQALLQILGTSSSSMLLFSCSNSKEKVAILICPMLYYTISKISNYIEIRDNPDFINIRGQIY